MTTAEIESYANEEALIVGASDLNLKVRLRRKVIPKWEMDVGECAWRRKTATLSFAATEQEADLPADFGKMLDGPIFYNAAGDKYGLEYIGDDPSAIALANASTTPGTPYGWWMVRLAGADTILRRFRLDKPTDSAITVGYAYISELQFADETTSVDLIDHYPLRLHWALVEALRMEIFASRLKIDDPRLMEAKSNYAEYVQLAQELREPGMRHEHKRIKVGPL